MKRLLISLIAIALFSSTGFGAVTSKETGKQPKNKTQELSRQQLRNLAKKYIKSILDEDYIAWSSLMVDTKETSKKDFMSFYGVTSGYKTTMRYGFCFDNIKKIKAKEVRNDSITLDVYTETNKGSYVTPVALLLLPDGKIKYDAFIVRHPLFNAKASARFLLGFTARPNPNTTEQADYTRTRLYESGVPLFGFDEPSASKQDKLKALKDILEWISKNRHKWDSSDPKVYLPQGIVLYQFRP